MFSTSTLIRQIRDEYRTLPGLKLTAEEACRLWAVNLETCEAAFAALIEEGFLHGTGTGKFIALPSPSSAAARVKDLVDGLIVSARCPHCQKLNPMENGTFRCAGCRKIVTFTALSA